MLTLLLATQNHWYFLTRWFVIELVALCFPTSLSFIAVGMFGIALYKSDYYPVISLAKLTTFVTGDFGLNLFYLLLYCDCNRWYRRALHGFL